MAKLPEVQDRSRWKPGTDSPSASSLTRISGCFDPRRQAAGRGQFLDSTFRYRLCFITIIFEGTITREPKHITLTLTKEQAAYPLEPVGEGGHQSLLEMLRSQLTDGNLTVDVGDEDLGKIIRYMTQYGSGGFRGRLHKALGEPIVIQAPKDDSNWRIGIVVAIGSKL